MTEYEDKSAIVEVLNLYGFALDAREWDLFDRIFTADVIAEFGPAGAAWSGLDVFKRSFAELASYLFRSQTFPNGAILLTGTGIVPPDTFSLTAGDLVHISISGIGTLENKVITV